MGLLAFPVVAHLVARSSSVIDTRLIVAKVHPTMVEVNPTTVVVELTVVEDDLVAEQFDSETKELDLVLVHLNFTTTSLFRQMRR
jgi:hypothetical protein